VLIDPQEQEFQDDERHPVSKAYDNVLSSLLDLERELSSAVLHPSEGTPRSSKASMIHELQQFSSWLKLNVEHIGDSALTSIDDPSGRATGATLLSSIINLAKTCVGTGILTLPYAFRGCGLLWGWGFTLLTGGMAAFTLFLLGEVASLGGRHPTLNAIGARAAGTAGSVLVDISVCMNNIGAMISYLVIASTTITNMVEQNFHLPGWPRQVYVLLALALVAPLCLVRRVNTLRFSSSIAMIALALVTVMIVLFAIPWGPGSVFSPCGIGKPVTTACKGEVALSASPTDILTQFVIFTNAYTCQHAMVPIVAELDRPTRRRRCIVIFGAMGAVCFLLLVVGTAGYLTFGAAVQSNVLFSYPHDSMFAVLALVGIIIDVLSSYPLLMFMTRISVSNLLRTALTALGLRLDPSSPTSPALPTPRTSEGPLEYSLDHDDFEEDEPPSLKSQAEARYNSWRHIAVISPMDWSDFISDRMDLLATLLIMIFTVAVALAVDDLGIVAALTGATGATMIGYVVPGMLYVLLSRQHDSGEKAEGLVSSADASSQETFVSRKGVYAGAGAIFMLGCVLMPAGVTLTLAH